MISIKAEDLVGITPNAIDRYLYQLGWVKDLTFLNKNMWRYFNGIDTDMQMLVPARNDFVDYFLRLSDVVEFLSEVNNRAPKDIVNDLKTTYSDHLEFRIISSVSEAGKLPLDFAAGCIEGIKNLILYSACAEQEAKPICLKAGSKAKESLSKFELGQTKVGSFVINVETKVADENDDHIIRLTDPTPSAEHKIVERITTAMQQIENAAKPDVRITDVAVEAYRCGITANMCESLLKLKQGFTDVELETTIRYASAITDRVGVKRTVHFGDKHFAIIGEMAKIYRDQTIVEDMILTGIIKNMRLLGQAEHTISVECTVDKVGRRIVQATLSEEQHILACSAYESTLMIRMEGVVDKSKKIWFISELTKFQVLSQEGQVTGQA